MRSFVMVFGSVLLFASVAILVGSPGWANDDNANVIEILDNCDPGDPGYDPTGGCALKPKKGDVPEAEFAELLFTPLDPSVASILIGHPSWRNEPSYVSTVEHRQVRIRNRGGRAHTFTEVESFGGGFIPPLNGGLEQAPECNAAVDAIIPPGGAARVKGLAPGLHKFQCCIHPWMRAAIRVE